MALFAKKDKEKKEKESCCGSCDCDSMEKAEEKKKEGSGIKILGSGCSRCKALGTATEEALAELHIDAAVDHVTDFSEIAAYGVMSTPALVVDGKVVSYGKVLNKEEVRELIRKARNMN